jgi:hypothetical protein
VYNIPLASAQGANAGFLTYTNTDLGFTIKYPSDWTVNETDTADIKFTSPDRVGLVFVKNINLRPNETSMSWEDYVKKFNEGIKIFEH